MKFKYSIIILFILSALQSCYRDLGNYDYSQLNDIEINFGDYNKDFVLGDTVKITPSYTYALGSKPAQLSYKWTLAGKEISQSPELDWIADTVVSNGSLELRVLDNKSGITYFSSGYLTIKGAAYNYQGWVILSEKSDGSSSFSYLRYMTEKDKADNTVLACRAYPDAYDKDNGESLGSKPIRVLEHFSEQWDGEDEQMGRFWIIQQGGQGPVQVSGRTFLKTTTLADCFESGSLPSGFVPEDIIDMQWVSIVAGEDGTAYTRKRETCLLFNSGAFLDGQPLMYENEPVNCSHMIWGPYSHCYYTLLYDPDNNRYLAIDDSDQRTAGRIVPLFVSENQYEANPNFSRLDNLGDKRSIFCGISKSDTGWGTNTYLSLLRDEQNNFYIQRFTTWGLYYTDQYISADLIGQERANLSAAIIGDGSQNVFHQSRWDRNPFLYIGKGGQLWLYYLDSSDSENSTRLIQYLNFDANITSIDTEYYNGTYTIIGLDNGDVYIVDTTKDSVNKFLRGEVTQQDLILDHASGFGTKVVHVRYKVGYGNGWGFQVW